MATRTVRHGPDILIKVSTVILDEGDPVALPYELTAAMRHEYRQATGGRDLYADLHAMADPGPAEPDPFAEPTRQIDLLALPAAPEKKP